MGLKKLVSSMLIAYSSECSSLREIEANIDSMVQMEERLESTPFSISEGKLFLMEL